LLNEKSFGKGTKRKAFDSLVRGLKRGWLEKSQVKTIYFNNLNYNLWFVYILTTLSHA
jgi:hypothetical protein